MSKREHILETAISIAQRGGLTALNRDELARRADVPNGSINHYFETMDHLRSIVIRAAIDRRILRIVGEAVAARHPLAKRANRALREAALASLVGPAA